MTRMGRWMDGWFGQCVGVVLVCVAAAGCFLGRDPLDPLGELDHRVVRAFEQPEREARGRRAYERARGRIGRIERGMSIAEVEVAMGAIVLAEDDGSGEESKKAARKKVVEGLLCEVDPSPLQRRWLFGYDENGVELIGFSVEFRRHDPEDEDWEVQGVDRDPRDGCPDGSGT